MPRRLPRLPVRRAMPRGTPPSWVGSPAPHSLRDRAALIALSYRGQLLSHSPALPGRHIPRGQFLTGIVGSPLWFHTASLLPRFPVRQAMPRGTPTRRYSLSPVGHMGTTVRFDPRSVGVRRCLTRRPWGPANRACPLGRCAMHKRPRTSSSIPGPLARRATQRVAPTGLGQCILGRTPSRHGRRDRRRVVGVRRCLTRRPATAGNPPRRR
jgi:hypothetical protein